MNPALGGSVYSNIRKGHCHESVRLHILGKRGAHHRVAACSGNHRSGVRV